MSFAHYAVIAFCAWVALAGAYVALGLVWNFSLERRLHRAPALRVYFAVWLREWLVTLNMWASYVWGWRSPPKPVFDPQGGPPIALVHGYFMNWASMRFLAAALKRRGFTNIYYVEPRPLGASLQDQASHLARELEAVSAASGGQPAIAIGHSQGGLLLRVAALREPSLKVKLIVTLGAPHAGTAFAAIGPHPSALHLRVGSAFLQQLGVPTVPIRAIYTDTDNVVFPAQWGEPTVALRAPAMGHFGLITRAEVVELIVEAIQSSLHRP